MPTKKPSKTHEPDAMWGDDLLGRRADARILIDFVTGRVVERARTGQTSSYVVNVDAAWGQGKTFFLDRLRQQLDGEGYLVAQVNAWEDDHADDPLIAVMASLDRQFRHKLDTEAGRELLRTLKRTGGRLAVTFAKHGLLQLGKKAIGEAGVEELGADLTEAAKATYEQVLNEQAESLLQTFDRDRCTIEEFRRALTKFVELGKGGRPLFILIDEVDRCRPPYAIALLERIKHLFNVKGVVFVVATDTKQLQHAISAVYGSGFDAAGYLGRFFDRTYSFAQPALDVFVQKLFDDSGLQQDRVSVPPDETAVSLFVGMMQTFGVTLRDAGQCFDILRSVVTLWPKQVPSDQLKVELIYLLPLIFVYHKKRDHFDNMAAGDFNILEEYEEKSPYMVKFLGDERFHQTTIRQREETHVSLMQLVRGFVTQSRKSLPEIVRKERSGGSAGWIRDRFYSEYNVLHNASHVVGNSEPRSIVDRYPELVRTAGRFGGGDGL